MSPETAEKDRIGLSNEEVNRKLQGSDWGIFGFDYKQQAKRAIKVQKLPYFYSLKIVGKPVPKLYEGKEPPSSKDGV